MFIGVDTNSICKYTYMYHNYCIEILEFNEGSYAYDNREGNAEQKNCFPSVHDYLYIYIYTKLLFK